MATAVMKKSLPILKPAAPQNLCGSCSLCCKLLAVVDSQLTKPRNTWCEHFEKGTGCSIYAVRPQACSDFACEWLGAAERSEVQAPLPLRPDKCGVVMVALPNEPGLSLHVDPGRPLAWREPVMRAIWEPIVRLGHTVVIAVGRHRFVYKNMIGAPIEYDEESPDWQV
jgi:uncharacterized protein